MVRMLMILSLLMISSGCFLQPTNREEKKYNFVDYDAKALRLAKPVKAELLSKNPETGKWESIGEGEVPAGAYIKGRKPQPVDPTQEAPEQAVEKGN